jgi:hypothetical protein
MNASPAQNAAVPICASCGVVALAVAPTCDSCGEALARIGAPPQRELVWTAVRASFKCRSCGFDSPIEGLVVKDGIECMRCGSFQQFDPASWKPALKATHAVGDLGGPDPEGRFPNPRIWVGDSNPHKLVGVARTFENEQTGTITIDAAPGFPVCRACHRVLDVHIDGAITTTTCGGCGSSSKYEKPNAIAAMWPAAVGVVGEGERQGRVEARIHQGDAGVVTMTCPQCGAALKGSDVASSVECTYCHAIAFIPSRARPKGPGVTVKPILFFVAFNGPSPERQILETPQPMGPADILKAKSNATGFLSRGISPLPGIDLAPLRGGVDVKQLLLTLSLTALALVIGYLIVNMAIL